MGQSILLKRSAIPGKKPSANSLNLGEVALNTYDGRIFFKRSGSVESVQEVITTNAINTGSIGLYGGVNTQNYLINITGYNDTLQGIYLQNLSNGVSSSSDIVITADNGNSLINYVDLGINSSQYSAGNIGQANDSYLKSTGKNFYIGTLGDSNYSTNPSSNLYLFTNGDWQNPDMMISGSHVIGFGTKNITNGYKYEFSGGNVKINNNVLILGTLNATSSNSISSSYAVTASYALNAGAAAGFPFSGSALITGSLLISGSGGLTIIGPINGQSITASSLLVNGTITAQTLVVQTISASVEYVSGSTRFGSSSANTHQFTGSVNVTGSLFLNNQSVVTSNQTGSMSVLSSSVALTSSFVTSSNVWGPFGSNSILSSSYALTASFALNAGAGVGFPFTGSAQITGSLVVTGSVFSTLGFTGSLFGTSSWANNARTSSFITSSDVWGPFGSNSILSASFATSASQAITASYILNAVSASFASTASFVNLLRQDLTISGGLTILTGSGIEFQVGATGTKIGNLITDTHTITGSVSVSGSITATSFIGDGSQITNIQASSVSGLNLFRIASGSITASVQSGSFTVNSNAQITGTLFVSSSISASNINVGIPTSNDWGANLQGSYFNNFTTQTNVSEILRFIAGLLSSSAPDASPNTKTFGSISATSINTTTGTAPAGSIPQSSTNTTIIYLNSKGFATAGSTLFSGISTIYNSNFGYNYSSVAAGSSIISSSADAQLFGLGNLSSGNPTSFNVSGSFTFRFKDNSSKTDTSTSSSQMLLTQTGAGTTNGVSLAKINTVNTAVIPPAYQDGKFASTLTQYLYSGSATAVSASGYYHISASVRIASGSSGYSNIASASAEIFWAPTSTISTNIPAQTPATGSTTTAAITAVSRSLSGAPYLTSSTYTISSSITNAFNPMYYAGAGIASISLSGTGISATSGINTVTTAGGTIGTANAVYDSTGVTVRATSTIPFETDLVRVSGLYTLSTANITNVGQSSNTPTTFTLSINGINKDGSTTTKSNTISYHTAGTFGQPSASGSLAYYTRAQGADTATTSGSSNSEPFTGENFRIQLTDAILSFTGLQWNTSFGLYNLGGNDLQVKPGYLVKPGGTYGYWLADPDTTKTYKYYIRQITTNGGTKTSMTLNVGQTLVNWGTTTNNAIGALILFQSSKTPTYATARLYDPSDLLNNFVATKTANTAGQNPFGTNFDLYGNTGGSLSTTTYTIPLRNADGMVLDNSNTNIYVIIRYNGDPTPITSMTVTFA